MCSYSQDFSIVDPQPCFQSTPKDECGQTHPHRYLADVEHYLGLKDRPQQIGYANRGKKNHCYYRGWFHSRSYFLMEPVSLPPRFNQLNAVGKKPNLDCALHRLEHAFGNAADRAGPVIRKILEASPRCNS
jgi:hypothetical protein